MTSILVAAREAAAMKLTKAQQDLLGLLCAGPRIDITDDRIARKLEDKGLAFHFFESEGGSLSAVWTVTEAGRAIAAAIREGQP